MWNGTVKYGRYTYWNVYKWLCWLDSSNIQVHTHILKVLVLLKYTNINPSQKVVGYRPSLTCIILVYNIYVCVEVYIRDPVLPFTQNITPNVSFVTLSVT